MGWTQLKVAVCDGCGAHEEINSMLPDVPEGWHTVTIDGYDPPKGKHSLFCSTDCLNQIMVEHILPMLEGGCETGQS
uniref:MYM-type domain-containing protein n=1 Tax=viral metagenome TaxID=1070528 RepID=A0A6M3J471_9ZZZZ